MTDETQLKIYGLIDVAEQQQAELSAAIEALKAEREALTKALRAALADEMRQSLTGVATVAHEAENRLKGAVAWFSWRWGAIAALSTVGLVVGVWLAVAAAVQWETSDLQYLRGEIAAQQAALEKLTRKGGRSVVTTCGTPAKPCVQVDKSQEYGDGFFVIRGY